MNKSYNNKRYRFLFYAINFFIFLLSVFLMYFDYAIGVNEIGIEKIYISLFIVFTIFVIIKVYKNKEINYNLKNYILLFSITFFMCILFFVCIINLKNLNINSQAFMYSKFTFILYYYDILLVPFLFIDIYTFLTIYSQKKNKLNKNVNL
ncbi:MAG: hypothetical protein PUD59_02765 [bacterium]|nr:hypothetical protein [bacterium]